MKKTYITPAMQVATIQATQMIAASIDGFDKTLDSTGDSGDKALNKGQGDWEIDW
ncbi:MAG: hypothetical protein IJ739_01575 [Bacteroidaceae bacterium]|nr:hypothetical protein [Bacteroidaceae bacterium]